MPWGKNCPRLTPCEGCVRPMGLAEVSCRHVRDGAWVLKLQLQTCIGREALEREPVMPWLLIWAAMSMYRFKKGRDGRAPYQRQTGRKCELEVAPSGETIIYRMLEVANGRHQPLDEIWVKRNRVGSCSASPEVLMVPEEGIVKSWPACRQGSERDPKGMSTNKLQQKLIGIGKSTHG
ncbi:hypothetical protein N9L68_07055 [bacterium]|nr:hypothetical protein [bacterium]